MKIHALPIALVALLLTACGDKPAPATTAAAPAPSDKPGAAAPAPGKPKEAPTGTPLAAPMPQAVGIGFPYHVRTDKVEQTKEGESRRVILVEALGIDPAKLRDSVRRSMKDAGFHPMAVTVEAAKSADGSERLSFRKKGWDGRVNVALAPAGERKLTHKRATATVTYQWSGPGTAASAPAAAPATAAANAPTDE